MTKIEVAMREYADWCSAIGVNTLDKLRMVMEEGRVIPLINLCEARQERKYAEIANQIYWKKDKCRIVMMSGPSSSGKTSSSLRIAQQCRVLGLVPKVIELDNYFVDRDKTPRNADGKYDFEALEAMDINFLGEQISDLLSGREIELPKFDFVSGTRHFDGKRMRLEKGDILFMEGIHALDPAMTPSIETDKFFKIYVSALSALPSEDKEHNSTTDKRLLRRIVRDNRTRGISPEETILRWPSVREGELRYIFPFEENADVVFNSSMLYDLPVLKHYAQSLLSGITSESGAYEKAQSLLSFLSKVIALNDSEIAAIPPTSIMREFIGGQMLY
ncbi:MAG TPA: hypothetical protein DHU75_05395 [Rikenellaceae bacterium]|nr:hypothetical protein [Rikenellaceae bacterium]